MLLKPPVIAGQPTPVPFIPSTLTSPGIDPNTVLTKFQILAISLTHNAAIVGIGLAALLVVIYSTINMFGGSSSVTKHDANNQRLINVLIYAGVITAAGFLVQISVGIISALTT